MIITVSPSTYGQRPGLKKVARPDRPGTSWPIVGGKAMIEAAKMTGITPAMFTRSGRYVCPPELMRRPITRLAYWIGIRRWPSWMKTTAATTAIARNGIITLKTRSGFAHPACTPRGRTPPAEAVVGVGPPPLRPVGRTRHDRGEDQQRDAVADAALGYQLAHP